MNKTIDVEIPVWVYVVACILGAQAAVAIWFRVNSK